MRKKKQKSNHLSVSASRLCSTRSISTESPTFMDLSELEAEPPVLAQNLPAPAPEEPTAEEEDLSLEDEDIPLLTEAAPIPIPTMLPADAKEVLRLRQRILQDAQRWLNLRVTQELAAFTPAQLATLGAEIQQLMQLELDQKLEQALNTEPKKINLFY